MHQEPEDVEGPGRFARRVPDVPGVVLRAMRDGDEDEDVVFETLTDLESWELRTGRVPHPVTRGQLRAQLAERRDEAEIAFVIEAEARPVGRCVLFAPDPLAHHAEVGISLVADARGKGYGTVALAQLVEFGFERCNLHRLHLGVLASNGPARGSYLKVGFVDEGRLREHAWVRGRWEDEIRMGLLRSEWRARRS